MNQSAALVYYRGLLRTMGGIIFNEGVISKRQLYGRIEVHFERIAAMQANPSFTCHALALLARGELIPLSGDTAHWVPGLIWSGHIANIRYLTQEKALSATLTEKGRCFLGLLGRQ